MRKVPTSVATAMVIVFGVTAPALASPTLVAKAKERGYPAQNCQYCHVSKVPKKEGFSPADLNERGKYLLADKDQKKAKAIDLDALKAYPGGAEQK